MARGHEGVGRRGDAARGGGSGPGARAGDRAPAACAGSRDPGAREICAGDREDEEHDRDRGPGSPSTARAARDRPLALSLCPLIGRSSGARPNARPARMRGRGRLDRARHSGIARGLPRPGGSPGVYRVVRVRSISRRRGHGGRSSSARRTPCAAGASCLSSSAGTACRTWGTRLRARGRRAWMRRRGQPGV